MDWMVGVTPQIVLSNYFVHFVQQLFAFQCSVVVS